MKTVAWISLLTLCIVEVISLLCIFCGIAFNASQLEGGDLLIIPGCGLLAIVYFLTSLVPYHKKLVSTNPVFQQVLLVFRRLLYFMLAGLVFVNLFYILGLDGKETLGILVLTPLLALMVVVAVFVFMNKWRWLVVQWIFFRVAFFLVLYILKATAFF